MPPGGGGSKRRCTRRAASSWRQAACTFPTNRWSSTRPPRELIAHAALEAAQTKLEVMQALAQAKMELVEAKLHAVHSHVPPTEDTGGWWHSLWQRPGAEGEELSA